jgi:hypothetical protein
MSLHITRAPAFARREAYRAARTGALLWTISDCADWDWHTLACAGRSGCTCLAAPQTRSSSDAGVLPATRGTPAFRAKEDHPLVRQQVRPNVEGGLDDRRSQACRSDRLPARSGDDRGVAEAVARGLPELGGNRSLERASPPAATGSWETASDVGLGLRTNVWLQSVASVPTLRPGLSALDDPGRRPATGISPGHVRGLSCVRRPVASAMPLSAADRQHLGDRRCPRPSTRCSRTFL